MAWRAAADPATARFCRGYLAEVVHHFSTQGSGLPTPERHDAHRRVLYWLAAHPLPRRGFERLLAHRAAHSDDPEVRSLCALLLRGWGRESERERLLGWAERCPELPELPAWKESPYNHPHGPNGLQLR